MAAVDEFDLAESSDGGAAEAGASESGARSPLRSRSGPWPWVAAAAALVMIGALNAAPMPIVLGQQGIPFGLLSLELGDPPEVVWESEVDNVYVGGAGNDWLVVVSDDSGRDRDAVGLDPGTGAEVWRYHDVGNSCQWSNPVVCVEQPGAPDATIITIDAQDGTRRSEVYPSALAAVPTGDAMVVVEATETATESVVLLEADGSERWRVSAEAADTEGDQVWVWLRVDDETVSLDLSAGSIDLETGELSVANRWQLPDGSEIRYTAAGSMVVHTADGEIALGPDEPLLPYDDQLGGPVMVEQISSTHMSASRRVDGSELWQLGTPDCYPLARLLGTFTAQCWEAANEQIITFDQVTGETRWELPDAMVVSASAEVLLVADRAEGTLLALDPADGSARWSIPAPVADDADVTEISDGIILITESHVIRLRWD